MSSAHIWTTESEEPWEVQEDAASVLNYIGHSIREGRAWIDVTQDIDHRRISIFIAHIVAVS